MTNGIYTEIISECERFARKEVRPRALEADLAGDREMAGLLWRKSGELDLPILLVPESSGGAGMTPLTGGLVLDCLAAECAGLASLFVHHFAACVAVAAAGTAVAEQWLKALTAADGDGFSLAAVCFPPEPGDETLTVSGEGDHLVINGRGPLFGNAGLARTVVAFGVMQETHEPVAIRIDPSAPGVGMESPLCLPGLKINAFGRLTFGGVRLAGDDLLASGPAAKKMERAGLDAFYGFVAAATMGCARSALHKAREYAAQRYQFKQMIIQHQEIQRLLGNMRLQLDLGTAGYLDLLQGDQWRPPFHCPDASLVKAFSTDAAMDIVLDAIQIHGGYGYMHEYGLEKQMRDIKVLQLLGGTNPCLLVRHLADNL